MELWNINTPSLFNWNKTFNILIKLGDDRQFYENNVLLKKTVGQILSALEYTPCPIEPDKLQDLAEILIKFAEGTKSDYRELDKEDYCLNTLNSTKGSIYRALIQVAIKWAHAFKESASDRWIPSIHNFFESQIFKKNPKEVEFLTILGRSTNEILWLNETWFYNHVDDIFPLKDPAIWNITFTSFLYFIDPIKYELFNILKTKGHYIEAIKHNFIERCERTLIWQIIEEIFIIKEVNSYFQDRDSLIFHVIDHGKSSQLLFLIDSLKSQKRNISPLISEWLLHLWIKLIAKIERMDEKEGGTLKFHLIGWVSIAPRFEDGILDWIIKTISRWNYFPIIVFWDDLIQLLNSKQQGHEQILQIMIEKTDASTNKKELKKLADFLDVQHQPFLKSLLDEKLEIELARSPSGWIAQSVYRKLLLQLLAKGPQSKDEIKKYISSTLARDFKPADLAEIPDRWENTQPRWWRTCRNAMAKMSLSASTPLEQQLIQCDQKTKLWTLKADTDKIWAQLEGSGWIKQSGEFMPVVSPIGEEKIEYTFKCPNCNGIVTGDLYLPTPNYSSEQMSEGDETYSETIICTNCHNDILVEISNGVGGMLLQVEGVRDGSIYFRRVKITHENEFESEIPSKNLKIQIYCEGLTEKIILESLVAKIFSKLRASVPYEIINVGGQKQLQEFVRYARTQYKNNYKIIVVLDADNNSEKIKNKFREYIGSEVSIITPDPSIEAWILMKKFEIQPRERNMVIYQKKANKIQILNLIELDQNFREFYQVLSNLVESNPSCKLLEKRREIQDQLDKLHLDNPEYLAMKDIQNELGYSIPSSPETYGSEFGFKVRLGHIIQLCLPDQMLDHIPDSIGSFPKLEMLVLSKNNINQLPESISRLNSLRIFNCSFNRLTEIPVAIGELKLLKTLWLNGNQLSQLPLSIGGLNSLEDLQLQNNLIEELPASIGELKNLQIFRVFHNSLSHLPSTMMKLTNLKSVEVFSNPIIWDDNMNQIKEYLENIHCKFGYR